MNKPVLQSVILHLIILLLVVISGWEIFKRKDEVKEVAITVDIKNIRDKTNVKPQEEIKKTEKPKATPPKPTPPKNEKKPDPKPEPVKPKETVKPSDKPDPKPKEEEPKKETPKDSEELKELLKSLEDDKTGAQQEQPKQESTDYDPNQEISASELAYIAKLIKEQIVPCWNVPAGAMNAGNLKVDIDIDIDRAGKMSFVQFSDPAAYSGDPYYQVAADSARRAILDPRCNPLKKLPPMEKYEKWHELTISFNPQDLIY